jgi:hypothetical protein
MKIPKMIKEKIYKCSEYHNKATVLDNEIREWMYKNNLYNDGNIDTFIDCVTQTYNSDKFVLQIENEPFLGNDECYKGDL